ncbi:uncharacterized protein MONOS_14051 [Monocercomonoides exilis]|uniref:uncharacterized protein n=1 Tax=Monocercomonoides exilis TaxID=2049356 RepID=UPI003559636D|nr:hypothetical protein MONOS_14051 [Monocercomonoides exilis]|eukprot:MONOS_14051.1-p1 / transcript=MONOS_14051.1 / gene=MONOS_14051 / organism=Monocercomonoides_exilis_PA203 / gene_product=unspecified product / transcript_product=unspecified product / location=Mono_scaffold00928:4289-4543(+) / protein_length=85 / sequence_SO=supercontig / SO=protein_coding / is_pseudo=false
MCHQQEEDIKEEEEHCDELDDVGELAKPVRGGHFTAFVVVAMKFMKEMTLKEIVICKRAFGGSRRKESIPNVAVERWRRRSSGG